MTRLLPILLLVCACTGDEPARPATSSTQTFDEAMHIICDAPEKAEFPPEAQNATNRALLLASWIDQRVQNREARELMGSMAATGREGKLAALRSGAKRAGIERCALSQVWEAPP